MKINSTTHHKRYIFGGNHKSGTGVDLEFCKMSQNGLLPPTHLTPIDGGDKPGKSESEKNPDGICCHHVPNRTVRLRVADGCDLVSIVKNKIRGGSTLLAKRSIWEVPKVRIVIAVT